MRLYNDHASEELEAELDRLERGLLPAVGCL
jgi:hypothetical protein